MLNLHYIFIFSVTIVYSINADRRILDGQQLTSKRGYVVYLLKATSKVQYDSWICGGAIVSPWYIVTSAACVEDVKHMYAIAGYSKYVKYEQLKNDRCTREKKKKIVYVCVPAAYSFDYPKVEQWANIDIAVVKVESKYEFNDKSYERCCHYSPSPIEVNYDAKYQNPGTDAVVFGWGHTEKWRDTEDATDYNQDNILFGAVKLADKEECKKGYGKSEIKDIIEKYMICSIDQGNLDDSGDLINATIDGSKLPKKCGPGSIQIGNSCLRMSQQYRRDNVNATRRKGICQNDHGGPLVTWRGPKEILIGLASVFKVREDTKACVPPFLYTSTYCNGAFLHCLLNQDVEISICNKPAKVRGFEFIRRTISWVGHPDGPAENEMGAAYLRRDDRSLASGEKNETKAEIKPAHDVLKEPEVVQEKLKTIQSNNTQPRVDTAATDREEKPKTKIVERKKNNAESEEDIKFSDILQPKSR